MTYSGGRTYHAAIIAREFSEIPSLSFPCLSSLLHSSFCFCSFVHSPPLSPSQSLSLHCLHWRELGKYLPSFSPLSFPPLPSFTLLVLPPLCFLFSRSSCFLIFLINL